MSETALSETALNDELWLVDFGEPYPSRAGVPSSGSASRAAPEEFGSDFPVVIVAPLTTTHRGLSLHIKVPAIPETGLHRTSYIQCEQLRSINRQRLLHKLGIINPETSLRVDATVRILLNH